MIGPRLHGVGGAGHGLLLCGEGWPGMFVHGDLAGRSRWFLPTGWTARAVPAETEHGLPLLTCFARGLNSEPEAVPAGVARRPQQGRPFALILAWQQDARNEISTGGAAKNPRALSSRPRRAQTFLRTMGIEITFSREGRSGTRMISVSTNGEDTVSNVSTVSAGSSNGSGVDQFMVAGSDH